MIDECDAINAENCMLKDVCSELKKDVRMLKHANEILKCEKRDHIVKNYPLLKEKQETE